MSRGAAAKAIRGKDGSFVVSNTKSGRSSIGDTNSTGDKVAIRNEPLPPQTKRELPENSVIREAVYNHLRYLRATGKTHISTSDVARALGLPTSLVQHIALGLGAKLED